MFDIAGDSWNDSDIHGEVGILKNATLKPVCWSSQFEFGHEPNSTRLGQVVGS